MRLFADRGEDENARIVLTLTVAPEARCISFTVASMAGEPVVTAFLPSNAPYGALLCRVAKSVQQRFSLVLPNGTALAKLRRSYPTSSIHALDQQTIVDEESDNEAEVLPPVRQRNLKRKPHPAKQRARKQKKWRGNKAARRAAAETSPSISPTTSPAPALRLTSKAAAPGTAPLLQLTAKAAPGAAPFLQLTAKAAPGKACPAAPLLQMTAKAAPCKVSALAATLPQPQAAPLPRAPVPKTRAWYSSHGSSRLPVVPRAPAAIGAPKQKAPPIGALRGRCVGARWL